MQAAALARKLCLAAACLAPGLGGAGGIQITVRLADPGAAAVMSYNGRHLDYVAPLALPAFFAPAPRFAPQPSPLHLGLDGDARAVRMPAGRAVAIDARTFVAGGLYYRVLGAEPLPAGSPEEAEARARLQALIDAGPAWQLHEVLPSGFRVVSLRR
jgi:hypothetical protein